MARKDIERILAGEDVEPVSRDEAYAKKILEKISSGGGGGGGVQTAKLDLYSADGSNSPYKVTGAFARKIDYPEPNEYSAGEMQLDDNDFLHPTVMLVGGKAKITITPAPTNEELRGAIEKDATQAGVYWVTGDAYNWIYW